MPSVLGVDPYQALIVNAGVAGVFIVLFLLGIVSAKPSIERERAVADAELARRQALIDTLLAVYHHEVLPTLGDYEKRLAPLLERVERTVDRLEREAEISERTRRAQQT
jgi:hypothetical protein